ncbi:MAG: hypothetical protein GF347_00305 [Candidatus Moranbacteria bacterium]|nr:hypothetical protein [Candidatus Moranbacteria bacterium]
MKRQYLRKDPPYEVFGFLEEYEGELCKEYYEADNVIFNESLGEYGGFEWDCVLTD